jgi:hypothetical protein
MRPEQVAYGAEKYVYFWALSGLLTARTLRNWMLRSTLF